MRIHNMKNIYILLAVLSLSMFPYLSFAQEEIEDTTVKVDSTTYLFQDLYENIRLFFTFDSEKKFDQRLEYAEERLEELNELKDVVDEETLQKLEERYEYQLKKAEELALKKQEKTEERLQKIYELRERHILRLMEVSEQVPQEAKGSIDTVIERSIEKYESIPQKIEEAKENKVQPDVEKVVPEKIRKTPEQIEEYKRLLRESKLQ